jgi:Putative F0F1-ATPase subunit Ca2+/Mg2+ transporter
MRYAGLGVQLAVSLLVFVLAGQWADKKLGTGGILTVVAAFVGFGGTMYSLIRSLNRDAGKQDGGGEAGNRKDGGDKAGGA